MSKIYSRQTNGSMLFVDKFNLGSTIAFPLPTTKATRLGTVVQQKIEAHEMVTYDQSLGCVDVCSKIAHGEYVKLNISHLAPRDAAELSALKLRIKNTFQDIERAIDQYDWLSGFQPPVDAVFDGSNVAE